MPVASCHHQLLCTTHLDAKKSTKHPSQEEEEEVHQDGFVFLMMDFRVLDTFFSLSINKQLEMNLRRKQLVIEDLPDEIIHHILSFIPTEDVIKASSVSKRWQSLWFPLTVLDFDFNRFINHYSSSSSSSSSNEEQKNRFVEFVNHMMLLHEGQSLQQLRISINVSAFGKHLTHIQRCILFASKVDSAAIYLDFWGIGRKDIHHPYNSPHYSKLLDRPLPAIKYCFQSFIPVSSRIKYLKTIVLVKGILSQTRIYGIIQGCQVLEELHLLRCHIPTEFEFDAPNSKLKCLVLDLCKSTTTKGVISSIRLNFPSLLKFKFVGVLLLFDKFSVKADLIETELKFNNFAGISFHHCVLLRSLLADLRSVNILTLCSCSLQILTIGNKLHKSLQHPLCKLKHLTLCAFLGVNELQGLACLLRSSPFLETISINLGPTLIQSGNFWESQLVPYNCLHHLKRVKITGFQGLSNEMGFVKYILKNGLVLKEMIIREAALNSPYIPKRPDDYENQLELLLQGNPKKTVEDLLALERASPDVQILFS